MHRSVLLAAASLLATAPALAQEIAADGRTVYARAWYERFQPATAWDMAARTPGFTLQETDQDLRGFAGAAGNVVIDGARPSAKAETLEQALRRIPAAQVERIELVPGQTLGGEYRARALVLNVVLAKRASALSGTVEVSAQYAYTERVAPSANLSVTRRDGDRTLNLAARYSDRHNPDEGFDQLFDAAGNLVERRDKFNQYHPVDASLSADWAWTPAEDRAVRLNGRLFANENPLRHRSAVSGAAGPLRNDTIDQTPERSGFEAGGDVSRPAFGGVAKLVALTRRETATNQEVQLRRSLGGDLLGGVEQAVDNDYGETVARLTWARENLLGWSVETGAEAALNTLESDVDLFSIGASGARTPIALPASNVEVEERRAEAFVSGGRALSPTLQFDWGFAVEASTLTVGGDATAERSLTFPKPRASLEWRPAPGWRLRGSVDRLVSQLNFDDFVSTAEIANDRVNSGNAEIEPERTWRFGALFERKLLGDGTIRVSVNYDQVEAVVDRVPTGVGLDAPGNLGDGRRIWTETVANLPIDRFGVNGGRVNLRWYWQDSSVIDPYTGRERDFSSENPWLVTAGFRQDLKGRDLAWGVDYSAEGRAKAYRLNETDVWNPDNLLFSAFLEYRPTERTTLTVRARNLFDNTVSRYREFYAPDRSSPTVAAVETRDRWQRRGIEVTLKRAFG